MSARKSHLNLERVSARRDHSFTLGPITLSLEGGTIYSIVGENGSGKSTLLSSIYGELPIEGQIAWNGNSIADLPPFERPFTYVRQDFPLLEMYSVRETLLLSHAFAQNKTNNSTLRGPRRNFKIVSRADQERAEHIAETIGIKRLLQRRLAELSGGQRQRVAIAASLAAKGKTVILLDEPTSALGEAETIKLFDAVTFRLNESDQPIIIIVTHDLDFIQQLKPVKITLHATNTDLETATPQSYIASM